MSSLVGSPNSGSRRHRDRVAGVMATGGGLERGTRLRHAVVLLTVLALSSSMWACGGSTRTESDVAGNPVPQPEASESITREWPAPEQSEESLPSDSGDVAVPSGEIWQWALGRNIWDDEALAGLAATIGPNSDSITIQPYGFQLDVDASGTVAAVLLFNDEVALGLPASESSFSAYQGSLPAGLSWQDTYDTVVGRYGEGALLTGGWGVPFSFAYQTEVGYEIDLTFLASHSDELPGAPLHIVTLRALPG